MITIHFLKGNIIRDYENFSHLNEILSDLDPYFFLYKKTTLSGGSVRNCVMIFLLIIPQTITENARLSPALK